MCVCVLTNRRVQTSGSQRREALDSKSVFLNDLKELELLELLPKFQETRGRPTRNLLTAHETLLVTMKNILRSLLFNCWPQMGLRSVRSPS